MYFGTLNVFCWTSGGRPFAAIFFRKLPASYPHHAVQNGSEWTQRATSPVDQRNDIKHFICRNEFWLINFVSLRTSWKNQVRNGGAWALPKAAEGRAQRQAYLETKNSQLDQIVLNSRLWFADSVTVSDVFFCVLWPGPGSSGKTPPCCSHQARWEGQVQASNCQICPQTIFEEREVVFLPARPDKPLPACGWARSKPDGKIWFAPYNANFAKTQPLNLKVAGTSGFLHNFGSMSVWQWERLLRFFERWLILSVSVSLPCRLGFAAACRCNAPSRPRRRTAPRSLVAPRFSKLGHAWVHASTSQIA